MMDWENLRYFAALARNKTLLGAARALKVEHATVARRVAALEAGMGVKLVDRRGRRLTLTPQGQEIAAMAETMERQADAIARAASVKTALNGYVTISAPPALASLLLAPRFVELQRNNPGLQITILGETRAASLNRREADIAVRLSRPEQGDLTLVKAGNMRFGFYASPAYLAQTAPEHWQFIAYDQAMAAAPQHQILVEAAKNRPIMLRASTLELQLALAQAGGGIALLPAFMAQNAGGLSEAALRDQPFFRDIWLVVHNDVKSVPAIRAVLDCLKSL
jgi:DNA-binding transcriptional LysR family regulator